MVYPDDDRFGMVLEPVEGVAHLGEPELMSEARELDGWCGVFSLECSIDLHFRLRARNPQGCPCLRRKLGENLGLFAADHADLAEPVIKLSEVASAVLLDLDFELPVSFLDLDRHLPDRAVPIAERLAPAKLVEHSEDVELRYQLVGRVEHRCAGQRDAEVYALDDASGRPGPGCVVALTVLAFVEDHGPHASELVGARCE